MEPIDLEQLAALVQRTMPKPGISGLKKDADAGVVIFTFQSREFVVKPTSSSRLEIFELKGTKLFITGASRLAQVIIDGDRNRGVTLAEVIKSIEEAEGAFQNPQTSAGGFKLLAAVKVVIQRIIGHPPKNKA
ncbi:MAG: hypothetical protein UX89_C0017G0006 [Parcubacteria group bacterium GW2011_GWA2_47_16]|nr:MAG: hypothetical protein UX89_C0017G0006 [Parcubacteria group bacterium GW2011_GWA2_47_16]